MASPQCICHSRIWHVAIVALATACAPTLRPSPFSGTDRQTARVSVVVENNVFDDVTVYVESIHGRFRLGRVGGCSRGRFAPPSEVVGTAGVYHLVAVFPGRRRSVETRPIEVVPGGTTIWTLGASESLSSVVIR